MIRNFLTTAFRSLLKNKGFTVLNILGLSAGLATCLLIVFYVVDELSYDRYNTKASGIYRITEYAKLNGNEQSYAGSEKPLLYAIKDFPEIEKGARFIPVNSLFLSSQKFRIKKGTANIEEKNVVYTDSRIFECLPCP